MKAKLGKINVFVLAAIIAVAAILVIWGVNLAFYELTGDLLAFDSYGGEVSVKSVCGLVLEHYYVLSPTPELDSSSTLMFSVPRAIVSFIVIYVISYFVARWIKRDQ